MKKYQLFIFWILFLSISSFAQKQDSLLREFNNTENDSLRAFALYEIAMIQSDPDSGMLYFRKALSISDAADEYFVSGKITSTIGIKKFRLNQLDSAIHYWTISEIALKKALEIADNQIVEEDLANTLYNFALAYYYKGDIKKIIKYTQAALELRLKHDNKRPILNCYNILGVVHMGEDEYETARDFFSNGLDIAIQLKDTNRISSMYNNIALTYKELKKYNEALEYFNMSLSISKRVSLKEELATKSNIGSTYTSLKEYKKAKSLLLESVEGFEKLADTRGEIISLGLLGDLYLELKEWDNLLKTSNLSLKLLEELPILEQKKFTAYNLSMAYENLGSAKQALKYYKLHTSLKDSMFTEQKSKEIEKLEAEFEFEKKELQIGNLTKENLTKEIQITKEKYIRYALIGVFISVSLFSIILFLNFKRKQEKRRHKLALLKAEIEQRMLRSQMNPHFIFNALNSIQSYISTNHTFQAEVFLSKFSMLIRNILENSTHQYISLDNEIDTLRLYLELEKLRFDDKFDFEIDDQLMDSTIQIPPMLIQPFVENAIIHGMKGKSEKGHIDVRFSETENEMILCEIEDDGVGRLSTLKKDNKEHQSLATKLTSDRIDFFNLENEGKFEITIVDKKDELGNASGTKIEILIPFEN